MIPLPPCDHDECSKTGCDQPDDQRHDIAWQMFCNAHPVEAYQHNPDGFWKYFHARAPDMTREQMVALLKECEEPESQSPNHDYDLKNHTPSDGGSR